MYKLAHSSCGLKIDYNSSIRTCEYQHVPGGLPCLQTVTACQAEVVAELDTAARLTSFAGSKRCITCTEGPVEMPWSPVLHRRTINTKPSM